MKDARRRGILRSLEAQIYGAGSEVGCSEWGWEVIRLDLAAPATSLIS